MADRHGASPGGTWERYRHGAKIVAAINSYDPTMSSLNMSPADLAPPKQGFLNEMYQFELKEGLDSDNPVVWNEVLEASAEAGILGSGGGQREPGAYYAPDGTGGGTKGFGSNSGEKSYLVKPLGRGSTGRTTPNNLEEQLAMEEVMSSPGGIDLPVEMTDTRWPASDGWVKRAQNVNDVEIHYVHNPKINEFDDFKFID